MSERESRPSRTEKLRRLYELAAAQAGYFTAAQARKLGYSPRSLVHHVAAGHLERVSRGFYRLVGVPAGPHEDVVAEWLKLAPRRAVVSHDTALALYDLAPSRSREIHLTLPRERRPRTRRSRTSVKLHTTTVPLARTEVSNRFGVQLTSPARTIADVADIGADPSVVIEAADRAISTGLATPDELQAAVRGRSARVRQLVGQAIPDAARNHIAIARPSRQQGPD
jgi:predicted transcriptional regulator of viral defense system